MTRAMQRRAVSSSSTSSSSSSCDVAAAWVAWMGGASASTVRARRADLRELARFVAERTATVELDVEEISSQLISLGPVRCRALIAAWTTAQASRGLVGTTIARRISTVSSLLVELELAGLEWSIRLPRPAVADYQQRECLPWSRVVSVVDELEAAERWRELAAVLLVADVGLRRFEACGARAEHVCWFPLSIRVLRKRGRWRSLTMSERAGKAIDRLLDGRTRGPVLTSARGRSLSETGLADLLERVLGTTPHRMRNTGATKLYADTHDAELVRAWLDHDNLSTTQRYVALLEDSHGKATRHLADAR